MILTCYACPRQLCFAGSNRRGMALRFGWSLTGERYFCTACQADGSADLGKGRVALVSNRSGDDPARCAPPVESCAS